MLFIACITGSVEDQMAKTQAKKASQKSSQNDNQPIGIGMSKIAEEDENKSHDVDEEINSGFGNYLRSGEGSVINECYLYEFCGGSVFFLLNETVTSNHYCVI